MTANDNNSAAPRSSSARSCTTCAKAKAKCVREPQQSICDRCARLNKECHLKEPIARRRRSTKTSRAAQLEKLESKIEHLVHALSVQQPRGEYRSQLSPPLSTTGSSQSANVRATKGILAHVTSSRNTTPEAMSTDATRTPDSLPSAGGCCGPDPSSLRESVAIVMAHPQRTLSVTMYDAEILLNRYQRLMAPTFPFVVVPAGINAATLYNLKPFLLQAIITAASFHDITVQRAMMKDCLRDVTERIFMKGEKSTDLLEGLLVLIAWYHPHVFWSQQTSNLLHLALAMVIDLAIDRPAGGMCEDIKGHDCHPRSDTTASLAMNSQFTDVRILAGVFYMSSVFSCCFKRADPKPYSKYLIAGLESLEKTQEFATDLLLVRMTRLQHLMEEANSFDVSLPSTHLHIKTLLAELGRFKSSVGSIEGDTLLHLQYGITEVCILELSLFRLQEDKSASVREHVDHIYCLAASIQMCVDIFATIPHSSFLTLPFPVFGEFAHCLITMARLFALDVDGLRGRDLRETVRYNEIMAFAIDRFETANQTKPDGLNLRNDSFFKWSHRLKFMQQAFEPKLPIQSGIQASGPPTSSDTTSQSRTDSFDTASFSQGISLATTPADDLFSSDFFNTLDDNFWSSFRGDLDLGFADVPMS